MVIRERLGIDLCKFIISVYESFSVRGDLDAAVKKINQLHECVIGLFYRITKESSAVSFQVNRPFCFTSSGKWPGTIRSAVLRMREIVLVPDSAVPKAISHSPVIASFGYFRESPANTTQPFSSVSSCTPKEPGVWPGAGK